MRNRNSQSRIGPAPIEPKARIEGRMLVSARILDTLRICRPPLFMWPAGTGEAFWDSTEAMGAEEFTGWFLMRGDLGTEGGLRLCQAQAYGCLVLSRAGVQCYPRPSGLTQGGSFFFGLSFGPAWEIEGALEELRSCFIELVRFCVALLKRLRSSWQGSPSCWSQHALRSLSFLDEISANKQSYATVPPIRCLSTTTDP